MKPVLLFDIDGTLFNTKKLFDQYIKPALSKLYVLDQEEFNQTSDLYWRSLRKATSFQPAEYLAFLVEKLGKSVEELAEIFYTPQFYRDSVYEDVHPTLAHLRDKVQLGIFSEGNIEFQKTKLRLGGLDEFFDLGRRYIFTDKLANDVLMSLPAGSIVVDDNQRMITGLLAHEGTKSPNHIWLNRLDKVRHADVRTCYSLSEIPHLF